MSKKTRKQKMSKSVARDPREQAIPSVPQLTDEELETATGGTIGGLAGDMISMITKGVRNTLKHGEAGRGSFGGVPTHTPQ